MYLLLCYVFSITYLIAFMKSKTDFIILAYDYNSLYILSVNNYDHRHVLHAPFVKTKNN